MNFNYISTRVHYDIFGNQNKKALFFLHGWGCDGSVFNTLVKDMQKFYKCVVITFPPFGKSQTPKGVWEIDNYSEIIDDLANQLQIENFAVICHSFGSRVALKFSSCYNKISALIITGGAGLRPRRGLKYFFKVWFYKIFKKFLNTERFGSEDYKRLEGNMRKTFTNIVNTNQIEDAKKVSAPTLLIYGSKDNQTKLYMAKKFNKAIKNSLLKVYEGVGHFAFLERPEMFFSDTFEFLQKYY